jgi:hypothetical protein
MLSKSLLLFAIPIVFAPTHWVVRVFGIWVWLGCEEGLKAFASTREEKVLDKFWLVALFGIWELALDKPFWGLVLAQSGGSWDRLSLAGAAYATALPALMHAVTAAIYAFTPERRLWAALLVSWTIHASFNGAALYFYLSPVAVILETVILCALLATVFRFGRRFPAIEVE